MLTAMVANDLKTLSRIVCRCVFFRAAFRASLWRRHITLIKHILLFLGKEKGFFTLNTRGFNIRHGYSSFLRQILEITKYYHETARFYQFFKFCSIPKCDFLQFGQACSDYIRLRDTTPRGRRRPHPPTALPSASSTYNRCLRAGAGQAGR